MSKTSRYAHALTEGQPVVAGPFETDTTGAPGTTGRVVVVVALVVVVVTAALVVVVVVTAALVVVVTAALVVVVAAGSAGESLGARVVVVELPRRVGEVVEPEVAPDTSTVSEVPETRGADGFVADRLVVVVLSDPAAGSPELPPEQAITRIENAARVATLARRGPLMEESPERMPETLGPNYGPSLERSQDQLYFQAPSA